jgi:hypothetical protein
LFQISLLKYHQNEYTLARKAGISPIELLELDWFHYELLVMSHNTYESNIEIAQTGNGAERNQSYAIQPNV